MRRKIGVAVATGAVVLLAATPSSAATTGWYSSTTNVEVNGCWVQIAHGTLRASAQELYTNPACVDPASGTVGAQARYLSGGVYYPGPWAWGVEIAITSDASVTKAGKAYH
jgi:hypothetical protein